MPGIEKISGFAAKFRQIIVLNIKLINDIIST